MFSTLSTDRQRQLYDSSSWIGNFGTICVSCPNYLGAAMKQSYSFQGFRWFKYENPRGPCGLLDLDRKVYSVLPCNNEMWTVDVVLTFTTPF